MTDNEKLTIQQLRDENFTYSAISVQLRISENTIKSFCRRSMIKTKSAATVDGDLCKSCGKRLRCPSRRKSRKFCSDACRFLWWANHRDHLQKTAVYKIACACCENTFESYGNKHRKYCGHACYIKDRFKGGRTI